MISSRCVTFGDKMLELRNRKGYSQAVFAKMVGTSRQVVSSWESNSAQPNASKFSAISQALGAKMEFMFDSNRSLAEITEEDCLNIDDPIYSELLRESLAQRALTEQKQAEQECSQDPQTDHCNNCCAYIEYLEQKNSARKKKIKKIAIGALISAIILGVLFIVFGFLNKPTKLEGDFDMGESLITWNFSPENIGWIIFGVAVGICAIIGIIQLCKFVKRKMANKKAEGENNDKQ